MRDRKPEVRDLLIKERKLSDGVVAGLKAALGEFKSQYRSPVAAGPVLVGAKS
jgi:hypothetical protein